MQWSLFWHFSLFIQLNFNNKNISGGSAFNSHIFIIAQPFVKRKFVKGKVGGDFISIIIVYPEQQDMRNKLCQFEAFKR